MYLAYRTGVKQILNGSKLHHSENLHKSILQKCPPKRTGDVWYLTSVYLQVWKAAVRKGEEVVPRSLTRESKKPYPKGKAQGPIHPAGTYVK